MVVVVVCAVKQGWVLTEKEDKEIIWGAGNVLYFDPGGGHTDVYLSENSSLKISIFYGIYVIPQLSSLYGIVESLQSNHTPSLVHT